MKASITQNGGAKSPKGAKMRPQPLGHQTFWRFAGFWFINETL
jgi:hypothetical protein